MQLNKKASLTWVYSALAFFLPTLGFLAVMAIRGFAPFGSSSLLYSDMYHQYYPFFVSFRQALVCGDSLLFNWDVGMGIDYLGLIAYYLASPLNLLSVFVPDSHVLTYFSLLIPVKLGLASLFFSIFLQKIFSKNDFSVTIFGCFYGLCAWAMGYQWNIMWLDTFALLPLVVLGAISLLKDKKVILYSVCLFLSVAINYYIGLFTCIFIVLVFISYEICNWKNLKQFFVDFGRIFIISLLAVGMTTFLTYPAYAALQTTQSSINTFPTEFELNIASSNTFMGLLDAMRQVAGNMSGGLRPNFMDHWSLPNLYCGVVAIVLAFLYLTSQQVKLKQRLCALFLLLFFNLSFILRQLDYIWHGFHFTNMIPYRFSFLYSFVLLYMAYRGYLLKDRCKLWQVLVSGALTLGIFLCCNQRNTLFFWLCNGIFLSLYMGALLLPKISKKVTTMEEKRLAVQTRRERKKLSSILLILIMVMELTLNLVNFGVSFTGADIENYPKGKDQSQLMLQYMQERSGNDLFFRAETTHSETLNDGALNNYHGISAFTSSANVNVTKFMQALGLGARDTYNRYNYEETSPIANLFLNLRYVLERDGGNKSGTYFAEINHYGTNILYENQVYLPLGFLVDPQILNLDFETAYNELNLTNGNWNNLAFLNKLFRSATGVNKDAFSFVVGNHLSINSTSLELNSTSQTGQCEYTTDPVDGGTIVYKYFINKSGYACLDLYIGLIDAGYNPFNRYSVWKNGVELYNDEYSLSQVLGVADVAPGDVIELHVECLGNEHGVITAHCGILDPMVFGEGYANLNKSTLKLTTFTNTYLEGTIDCHQDGVLYTSIPQDGNWTALVDGKPAQMVTIGNAMVGILLRQGHHTVSFTYQNVAFEIGVLISLICLLTLLCIWYFIYREKDIQTQNHP